MSEITTYINDEFICKYKIKCVKMLSKLYFKGQLPLCSAGVVTVPQFSDRGPSCMNFSALLKVVTDWSIAFL